MHLPILFDYPIWFLFLCILTGLVYSGLLYFRNRRAGLSDAARRVLAVSRFLVVAFLAFLLLGPLVKRLDRQVEQPLLIFMQDNSTSLLYAEDSLFYKDHYIPRVMSFLDMMAEDHDTRLYLFGEGVRQHDTIDLSDRMTDMAEVFRQIDIRYSNRNIGAVIIAGDGLYNRGINPLYAAGQSNYPVYTIALGDTMPRRDLIVRGVNHNQVTYLDNIFPVEVEIEALQSGGQSSMLTIERGDEVMYEEPIVFSGDHHVETISLQLEADQPGLQAYRALLEPLEGEVSLENNHMDFFIDVIDGRQQVLVLAHSPHPDIGALRDALVGNEQYDVDVFLADAFDGAIDAYDLVVLHQLPSLRHPLENLFSRVREANMPLLFVLGVHSDLEMIGQSGLAMSIHARTGEWIESLPEHNLDFVLFSLPESTRRTISNLPPLHSPFARYDLPGDANVLLHQKIGTVVTDDPLVAFTEISGSRAGIVAGEGIWRWRLHAYMREKDHGAVDELLGRIVQFLALQEDRSRFRVQSPPLIYENEPVAFEAELYNASYELVNEPDVELEVTNEEGVTFPYIMGRTSNAYRLDAGAFPPGSYAWEASVRLGGEHFREEGTVHISALDLEALRTIADHNLLFRLAEQSGAGMFYPGQLSSLGADIRSRDDVYPRIYEHQDVVELINVRFVFFVVLVMLTLEWFIRKRSGGY